MRARSLKTNKVEKTQHTLKRSARQKNFTKNHYEICYIFRIRLDIINKRAIGRESEIQSFVAVL